MTLTDHLQDNPAPSPDELLAMLADCGITLRTDGARLWTEPKGSMTAELSALIDAHEGELRELLSDTIPACSTSSKNPTAPKLN